MPQLITCSQHYQKLRRESKPGSSSTTSTPRKRSTPNSSSFKSTASSSTKNSTSTENTSYSDDDEDIPTPSKKLKSVKKGVKKEKDLEDIPAYRFKVEDGVQDLERDE